MMTYPQKERYDINDLIEVIRMLRLPDGCPWDKVQTHESIRMNFIEEVYEVIEAIDKNDTALMHRLCPQLQGFIVQRLHLNAPPFGGQCCQLWWYSAMCRQAILTKL